jgi:hypothetical protein
MRQLHSVWLMSGVFQAFLFKKKKKKAYQTRTTHYYKCSRRTFFFRFPFLSHLIELERKWTTKWQDAIRVNVHNLAQTANWRSLVKTSFELQSCLSFKLIDLTKGYRSRGFWSSLLIWKRGDDCSSKDVFTRLRQFAACAKLCTFTPSRIISKTIVYLPSLKATMMNLKPRPTGPLESVLKQTKKSTH